MPVKVRWIGRILTLSTAAAVVKNYPPSLSALSLLFLLLPFTLITVWESSVACTRASLAGDFKDTAFHTIFQLHVKLVNYFLHRGAQGS